MPLVQLAVGDIADLSTQVAVHGAVSTAEVASDALFELIVGIVILIYEMSPG